jgi:DNA topoisomerase-2
MSKKAESKKDSSRAIPTRKQMTTGDEDEDSGEFVPSVSNRTKTQRMPPNKTVYKSLNQDKPKIELKSQQLHNLSSNKNKTAEETYQRLTLDQHILKRPDTYIGSVVKTESDMWVLDRRTERNAASQNYLCSRTSQDL